MERTEQMYTMQKLMDFGKIKVSFVSATKHLEGKLHIGTSIKLCLDSNHAVVMHILFSDLR